MSDKLEVKRGTKIDDQAAAKASKELAILTTLVPDGDVEGQYYTNAMTQCPYCGNVGWTRGLNTDFYSTVICGFCGRAFRAEAL